MALALKKPTHAATKLHVGAVACALSLVVCLPLVRPWVDMGVIDDPSYTRSAQILANTGHIVYNGWATAMLGWQLFLGAAFIKLFGFSFTVTRLSMLPVAMLAAFFSQRSMVRSGLTEWNATLATLTLVLSPLFIPLTFSYMTDVGGFLVIVLCFYGCLRAIQADSDAHASLWLGFSALTNGIGGSSRQISWLGLIVMIPCALWILRKRRPVLMSGAVFLLVGLSIMIGMIVWFEHQPWIALDPLWRGPITRAKVAAGIRSLLGLAFDAPVFLLPILIPFLAAVRWKNRSVRIALAASILVSAGILAFILTRAEPTFWLEPCAPNYFTSHGILDGTFIHGGRPVILGEPVRIFLTVVVLASLSGLAASFAGKPRRRAESSGAIQMKSLLILLVPFFASYCALLVPRATVNMVFDRYLLALLFIVLLLLARYYQERISEQMPGYAMVLVLVVGVFSVAGTHDAFAMLRARVDAVHALNARGIPDSAIDAGWEFNSWGQIVRLGHIRVSQGTESPESSAATDVHFECRPQLWTHIPMLRPKYMLSYRQDACGGATDFPPVPYHEWLGPRIVNTYIVKTPEKMSRVPVTDGRP